MAFVVMNGIQYMTLYAGPILAAIWTRAFRVQPRGPRRELHAHTVAALGVCLLLCGWRLSTVLLVLLDDKRERATTGTRRLHAAPLPALASRAELARGVAGRIHHVTAICRAMLGRLSLCSGLRVCSSGGGGGTFLSVCCWLAMGSLRWYQPSYWLDGVAVLRFGPFRAPLAVDGRSWAWVSRPAACWRKMAAVATVGQLRVLASSLVVIIATDFVVLGYQQLPRAFSIPPDPAYFPGPPVAEIVNVRDGLGYPVHHERIWRDPGVRADVELLPQRTHASPRPGGSGLSR